MRAFNVSSMSQANHLKLLMMSQLSFVAKQHEQVSCSLQGPEPDAAEHLLGSLLPDMVQLALRASELCTKVTAITNQSH